MEPNFCSKNGPGYVSPSEAMDGPREKILYIPLIPLKEKLKGNQSKDYLATIDVDTESPNYMKVIHRLPIVSELDELHHMGWNACSSCFKDSKKERRYLILPCIQTGSIYIVDTLDQKKPSLHKWIQGKEVMEKVGLTFPHTPHCLATGEVIISMMGDKESKGRGSFLILNENFEVEKKWDKEDHHTRFGYDFWYQPKYNIMVSSGIGEPLAFTQGFKIQDIKDNKYGSNLYFWKWKEHELIQTIELGEDGMIPLEVRFLHNPSSPEGFLCCALSSTVIRFYLENDEWKTEKVIKIPPIEASNWTLPFIPGLVTDIIISLDDKYLYLSNWLYGDVRQYDISNTSFPKMVGKVFVGGLLRKGTPISINSPQVDVPDIMGKRLNGGPQMIQLSLDGKRLYVTSSLLSTWDQQFYPEMVENGSQLIQIDVDTENGGLKLNENFIVAFKDEPFGPALAHEIRYPGGDCSSDIWVE